MKKEYIVTGATSGIGLAAAEQLAGLGMSVIGVGRSASRCTEVEQRLRKTYPAVNIRYLVADLSLQSQVRALAAQIREELASRNVAALDGLVNNAGTFTYWMTLTLEGFEMQWAVNHMAPFLLTHELLPLLQKSLLARVVTVSSGSHYHTRLNWDDLQLRRHYNGLLAYKQTKLCNVLFTAELNRRLGKGSTVRTFAADPGLVRTDIGLKGNPPLIRWIWARRASAGIPAEESAKGVVFLATEETIQDSQEIYWLHGKPKAPSAYALNADIANHLWEVSAQMCGITA